MTEPVWNNAFLTEEERLATPAQPSVQRPSLLPTSEEFQPTDSYIKRYSHMFRAADAAMLKLFADVEMLTEEQALIRVPIIFGTPDRAVAAILGKTVLESGHVMRVKLPYMALYSIGFDFDPMRYTYHKAVEYSVFQPRTERVPGDVRYGVPRGLPINRQYVLTLWTKMIEDANQIIEQVQLKFSPMAYVDIPGSYWENTVRIDSVTNNMNFEVADQDLRIVKFEIAMTLQAYLPQPISRVKTALGIDVSIETHSNPLPGAAGEDLPPDLRSMDVENVQLKTRNG